MQKQKRPWSRAEKILLLSPTLAFLGVSLLWWRRNHSELSIRFAEPRRKAVLKFSPDGKRLLVINEDNGLARGSIYDVASREKICDLKDLPSIFAFREADWSPDGTRIAAGGMDDWSGTSSFNFTYPPTPQYGINVVGHIVIWDSHSGRPTSDWLYAPRYKNSRAIVHFSDDGQKLIGTGWPLATFDAFTGHRLTTSPLHLEITNPVSGKMYSWATHKLASPQNRAVSWNGDYAFTRNPLQRCSELFNAKNGALMWQPKFRRLGIFQWTKNDIFGVCSDLSSGRAGRRNKLLLWDGRKKRTLPSPPQTNIAAFSIHDSNSLIAMLVTKDYVSPFSDEKEELVTMCVWNYQSRREVWRQKIYAMNSKLQWSPDGKFLAVCDTYTMDSSVRIFDSKGHIRYEERAKTPLDLTWAADSHLIALRQNEGIRFINIQ